MKKLSGILWIIFICVAVFVGGGAVWIYNTYGDFSSAISNEYFLNFMRHSRRSFLKWVLLPPTGIFVVLVTLQTIVKKKKCRFFTSRVLFHFSISLMVLSFIGAGIKLEVPAYFARQNRLSKEQWYDGGRVIIHALGEIDGDTYTNSKEALENSYQDGARFFECDFNMTSDGHIVACHDWNAWYNWAYSAENTEGYVPDFDEFMNTSIMGKYTALSGENILNFMEKHPDVYVITDTKDGEPETFIQPFIALVRLAEELDCKDVLDRLIVQIYHEYMYEMVNDIYPFPNYIFTLYQDGFYGSVDQMKEYGDFCIHHNIDVITMWADLYSDEIADVAERCDLQIFVHTVNDRGMILELLEKKVGVYTDVTDIHHMIPAPQEQEKGEQDAQQSDNTLLYRKG